MKNADSETKLRNGYSNDKQNKMSNHPLNRGAPTQQIMCDCESHDRPT